MKRIALIPAYKPDALMLELLERLSENGFSPVVVNDGSGEEFEQIFEKAKKYADVISHKENKGKGIALKTGLDYISKHFEYHCCIVTADADGQHSLKDIIRVAENVEKNPDALTLGVRRIDKAHMPFKNRSGNMFTRSAVFCVTGKYVSDSQTGLRGFTNEAISLMSESDGSGYEYEMNVLIRWLKKKKAVSEVPIETIYINNNASSHFKAWHDSCLIYKEISRFFSGSLVKLAATLAFFLIFALVSEIYIHPWGSSPITAGMMKYIHIASVAFGAAAKLIFNKTVFKPKVPMTKSRLRSVLFCAAYIIVSAAAFVLMTNRGMGAVPAKLLTELAMFVFSWILLKEVL